MRKHASTGDIIMKFILPGFFSILLSVPAIGASVSLQKPGSLTFYDISSVALTPFGVQIRVKDKPACLVSTEFLKRTNTSGLELLSYLSQPGFDYVVECYTAAVAEGYVADKIRPRMAP